jgi:voltage-gated potassium channel
VFDTCMTASTERRDQWKRRADAPLVVLGVAYIVVYSLFVLAPDLPRAVVAVMIAAFVLSWVAFALDYVVRIVLTPRRERWHYVLTRPIDALSVVLPVFRALRVLDLIREVHFLRSRSGDAIRARVVLFAVAYAATFMYLIALATLAVERPATDAVIVTFGDAVWWAFETVTTVGYGDMYPVTPLGRFYAVLLMMGGIVMIGVTSGTVVSYITDRIRAQQR